MPSSPFWARAATGLVATLVTCLSAAPHASADAADETSASAPVSDQVDPASAAPADVAAALHQLDGDAAATRGAVADAHAVLIEAEAALDEAEELAEIEEHAAELRRIEHSRRVDAPVNGVTRLLGDPHVTPLERPEDDADPGAERVAGELADARDAVVEAEEASEDAVAARDTAEADLDAYVESTMARTVARLGEADQRAVADPATADVIRAEEAVFFGPLAEVVSNQEAREAEDAVVGTGTEGETPVAPADPAPVTEPAPAPVPTPAPAPAPVPAPLPDPTGSASGAVEGAWCADGNRIVVDASLGLSVQFLVNDAAAAGVGLCGSGFRTYQEQVELRRAHCGSSEYAIYHAAPSSCSPPTARPGSSNHEDGLAVDFSCADGQPMTHASPCYQWLAANAANYGLYNLPSEPWHWSITGR